MSWYAPLGRRLLRECFMDTKHFASSTWNSRLLGKKVVSPPASLEIAESAEKENGPRISRIARIRTSWAHLRHLCNPRRLWFISALSAISSEAGGEDSALEWRMGLVGFDAEFQEEVVELVEGAVVDDQAAAAFGAGADLDAHAELAGDGFFEIGQVG